MNTENDFESYVFKTKNNKVGFFQKNSDICYLYIKDGSISKNYPYRLKKLFNNFSLEWDSLQEEDLIIKMIELLIQIGFGGGRIFPKIETISKITNTGNFFPRINRNNQEFYYKYVKNNSKFLDEIQSFYNIYENLNNIFNFVHPSKENLECFSHKIRELLILACTEVEYLLLQFLKDNKYSDKTRYSTKDYFKCKNILKLNDYSLSLKIYPNLGSFSPFENWNEKEPTKSLCWYDSYNSIKHDRGGNFNKSNLKNLIYAISAIHILLEAQYGSDIFSKSFLFDSGFSSIFKTENKPIWDIEELFVPQILGENKFDWKCDKGYFEVYPNKRKPSE